MSTEKMRAEFLTWWWHDDQQEMRMSCSQGWALHIWLSSRAAIEVELPSAYQNQQPYACYEGGWNDMRGEAVDNIESLGLKVKGG